MATPLPLVTDYLINGVWNDVTSRRRIGDGLAITRGRADWSARATYSSCSQVFSNSDGYFSNRLPTSANYQLIGRNTQLRHRFRWIRALFTSSVSSAWPDADTGDAWTTSGGAASDYSSSGGLGLHTHTSVNVFRSSAVETNATDMDVTVDAKLDIGTATGASVGHWVAVRYTDSSNYYAARLLLTTGGAITLDLGKRVAGSFSDIGGSTVTEDASHTAGDWWTVRVSVRGSLVRAMAWAQGTTAPTTWQLSVTDTSLTTGTKAACLSRLETGNTNTLNVTFSWDNFEYNEFLFWGEASSSAPKEDLSGNNISISVDARGILGRLSDLKRPVILPHTGAILASPTSPVAYWPLTDDERATSGASPIPGVKPMTPATSSPYTLPSGQPIPLGGGPKFAGGVGPAGSSDLPDFTGGGQLAAAVPQAADGAWSIEWVANWLPTATGTKTMMTLTTSGTYNFFQFDVGSVDVIVSHSSDGGTTTSGTGSFTFDRTKASPHHFRYAVAQSGGNYDTKLYLDGTLVDTADNFGSAMTGTVGHITGIRLNPQADSGTGLPSALGQVVVWASQDPPIDTVTPAFGYDGETAADRMARLCDDAGISFSLIGDAATTSQMGPQQSKTLLDLLHDCEDADLGILDDAADAFGLVYRTRDTLYNQTGPTLDYTAKYIGPGFQPIEDDQLLVNDITVKRINGSSAQYQVTSGPNSISDPPNGVGVHDTDMEVNVYADTQLAQIAGWIANRGTWDEARFPTLTALMQAPAMTADTTLRAQLSALRPGDVLTVTNVPAWMPPDDVDLMIQGSTVFIGNGIGDWRITWLVVPAGPYATGVYDTARYDSGGTVTTGTLTTTATSVSYGFTAGSHAGWNTAGGYDIVIGGEVMTVTSATASAFTVTRSVNGVVKTHALNEPVHVYRPGRYSL